MDKSTKKYLDKLYKKIKAGTIDREFLIKVKNASPICFFNRFKTLRKILTKCPPCKWIVSDEAFYHIRHRRTRLNIAFSKDSSKDLSSYIIYTGEIIVPKIWFFRKERRYPLYYYYCSSYDTLDNLIFKLDMNNNFQNIYANKWRY